MDFVVNSPTHTTNVTPDMISILADVASNVILVHETTQLSSSNMPDLSSFIQSLIARSESKPPVVFLATIYLERLRSRLPATARGLPCTRHRVFVAALIVAYKYLNDLSIKNKNWAKITQIFSLKEINLMERQFLDLLSFDLNFDTVDLSNYNSRISILPLSDSGADISTIDTSKDDPLDLSINILSSDSIDCVSDDNYSNSFNGSPSPPPLSNSQSCSISTLENL